MDNILLECMDSYGKITCSNTKDGKYDYKYAVDAIKDSLFIQLGSRRFTKLLSVDIDYHKDLEKVQKVMSKYNVPTPTFIVETSRGLHLHWVLKNRVSTSNDKAVYYRNKVNTWLLDIFGGDKRAVGFRRNFRNPTKHKTIYNDVSYSLDDFKLPEKVLTTPKNKVVKKVKPNKFIDYTKVNVGERHEALFNGVRAIAYKIHKLPKDEIESELFSWANHFNSQLPEPQSKAEITQLVTSITNWVITQYKGSSDKATKFNRNLAKQKADKAFNKVKDGLISLLYKTFSIKHIRELSARAGGRVSGVSKNTFAKYKEQVIKEVLTMLMATINNFTNIFASSFTSTFNLLVDSVQLKTKKDIMYGGT